MGNHGGAQVTYNEQGPSNVASAARAAPKTLKVRVAGGAAGGRAKAAASQSNSMGGTGGKRGGGRGAQSAKTETPLAKLAETEAAEKATSSPAADGQIHIVPASSIRFGLNPREHFDPEGIAELAASINEHGLLQPPTVRPLGDGTYQMIAGERRYRALQALNRQNIHVIIKDVSDEEAKKLALTENIARRDMLPGETGRAYAQLKAAGMSDEEIAKTAGKSVQSVRDHLALVEALEPHLQKLVDTAAKEGRGKGIPMSLVGPLAQLNARHREQVAERIMSPKGMSVQAAKTLIAALKQKEAPSLFGSTEHTPRTSAAHERYSAAMERLTATLGPLDDKTIEDMTPALANPEAERLRLRLAIKQLLRMDAIIARHVAAGEAAGM